MHWNYSTNGNSGCPTCEPLLVMTALIDKSSNAIVASNYILLTNPHADCTTVPDLATYVTNLCNAINTENVYSWPTTSWTAETQDDINFTYTGNTGEDEVFNLNAFTSRDGGSWMCNTGASSSSGTYKLYLKSPGNWEIDNSASYSFQFDADTL